MLEGHCVRYAVQESHGAGYGYPTIDSIRILDAIPKMYSLQSSVPMDYLSLHLSIRVAETIMIALMKKQQDMEAVSDDKSSPQIPSDISELSAIPYCLAHVEARQSPP